MVRFNHKISSCDTLNYLKIPFFVCVIYFGFIFAGNQVEANSIPAFSNSELLDELRERRSSNREIGIEIKLKFIRELIRAGELKEARNRIENLHLSPRIYTQFSAKKRLLLKHALASLYFKIALRNECIKNRTTCRMSMRMNSTAARRNAKKSFQIYRSIYKETGSKVSQWFLNVLSLTLDTSDQFKSRKWYIEELQNSIRKAGHLLFKPRVHSVANIVTRLGSVAIEDYNKDGHLDIFVSSFKANDGLRIFINTGTGEFIEKTDAFGLDGYTGGFNLLHGDYNNDGYVDILVLQGRLSYYSGRSVVLLENEKGRRFKDVTEKLNVSTDIGPEFATWFDFDKDGWIDLFLGRRARSEVDSKSRFLLNQNGVFENVTDTVGLDFQAHDVSGVSSGDFNGDGYFDLFVSRKDARNKLFRNSGDGTSIPVSFKNVTDDSGVAGNRNSFPTWFWDYNNDGFVDLFVGSFTDQQNKAIGDELNQYSGGSYFLSNPEILRNTGDYSLGNVTEDLNVTRPYYAMGANYADVNADGFLDVYLGTGGPHMNTFVPNRLLLNRSGHEFEDVTYKTGTGLIQKGHGIAFGDLDNDGDQDLYAVMGGIFEGDLARNQYMENTVDPDTWVTFRLIGDTSNRLAIGAKVTLNVVMNNGAKRSLHRTVSAGGSFGESSFRVNFGLRNVNDVKSATITWPNKKNTTRTIENPKLNTILYIREGA